MLPEIMELLEKSPIHWEIADNSISHANADLLLRLNDTQYCLNRLIGYYFLSRVPENVVVWIDHLVSILKDLPNIQSGLPRITKTSLRLDTLSPIAWSLYDQLFSFRFAWELAYPKKLLSEIWMDPTFNIGCEINGEYFASGFFRLKFKRSQSPIPSKSFMEYVIDTDLDRFFSDALSISLTPRDVLFDMSYYVLNPFLNDYIRDRIITKLRDMPKERVRWFGDLLRTLDWIGVPDELFLEAMI